MGLRFAVPEVRGRGGGLGNELFPWAKAFIASQELGLAVLDPAWGLNRRAYWRDFGTSRFDWVRNRALPHLLPSVRFGEADFRATGCDDYAEAIGAWARVQGTHRRGPLVVVTEGMWGGFYAIRKARDFVHSRLYKARGVAAALYAVRSKLPAEGAVVAVHVRMGDFAAEDAGASYRGRFDRSLPLHWFERVCGHIKRALGRSASIVVVSDGATERMERFALDFEALVTSTVHRNVCADLLLLAAADALVCSPSSYSMWGAFLSRAPYLWYRDNLQQDRGVLSLWGDEPAQKAPGGLTSRHTATWQADPSAFRPRGVALGEDGRVPETVLDWLANRRDVTRLATDLVYHGSIPEFGLPNDSRQAHGT